MMATAEEIERLAAEFHTVYQYEAERQGDVRHHASYAKLPENIKNFDRCLARYAPGKIREAEADGFKRGQREGLEEANQIARDEGDACDDAYHDAAGHPDAEPWRHRGIEAEEISRKIQKLGES